MPLTFQPLLMRIFASASTTKTSSRSRMYLDYWVNSPARISSPSESLGNHDSPRESGGCLIYRTLYCGWSKIPRLWNCPVSAAGRDCVDANRARRHGAVIAGEQYRLVARRLEYDNVESGPCWSPEHPLAYRSYGSV